MRVNQNYTLIVKFFRVALPLLALISVVVLIAWPVLNQEDMPPQETRLATQTTKPDGVSQDALQIVKPEFTGLDNKNRPYVITAETVYQGATMKADMTLVNPIADLELSETRWVSLRADEGIYRPEQESLTLRGAVTLSDNTGYHLETDVIDVDLKKGQATSTTPVNGNGPVGTVTAAGMTITVDGNPFVTFAGPSKFVLYPETIKK